LSVKECKSREPSTPYPQGQGHNHIVTCWEMQRQTGQGCLDIHSTIAGEGEIFFLPVRKQVAECPKEVMESNVDRDEMDGIVIVGHVNGKAGFWKVVHAEQVKNPG
jgi:hypothetical protein